MKRLLLMLVASAAAVLAAGLFIVDPITAATAATAQSTDETTETEITEPDDGPDSPEESGPDEAGPDLDQVAVTVVGADSTCPDDLELGPRPERMTRYDAICIALSEGLSVTPTTNLVVDGPDRLIVDPSFDWADNLPRSVASFELSRDGETLAVDIPLRLDVALSVAFEPVTGGQSEDEVDDGGSSQGNNGQSDDGTESADLPVLGPDGLTKVITISGRDRSVPGLMVIEQIRNGQFEAIVAGTPRRPDEGSDEISFEVTGATVSYQLALAGEVNDGVVETSQETKLMAGDEVLDRAVESIQLDSPLVVVDVQALAEVVGGDDTIVSVRVANQRDVEIAGPLVITLEPVEGAGLVQGFDDLGDGSVVDEVVTWPIPDGIGAQDEIVRTIQVDLDATGGDARIRWEGSIRPEGSDSPIDSATVTTDVRVPDGSTPNAVNFTPDQLIRLIAFVMAFALVAVIFGAWHQRSRPVDEEHSEEYHKNQLEMFRAYTEAILVLVILVSILVLALRGSLSGESAASLIGVIAGYALGRSLGSN